MEIPQLLDRELFFGEQQISGAQISPDGKFLTFLRPYRDTRNIWKKKLDEDFDQARPLTNQTERPISSYFWSRDGKSILYVKDQGGDENYHIYKVAASEKDEDGIPESVQLTKGDQIRAFIYYVCKKDSDLIYIGLNDRDPAWHDLYSLRISNGELTKLRENHERYVSWIFDHNDQLRLAMKNQPKGNTELWRVDEEEETKLLEWTVLDSFNPVVFHEDNQRLYAVSNIGEEMDLSALYLMDTSDGAMQILESDPEKKVDFGSLFFSDKKKELISTSYTDDRTRHYFKDKEFGARYDSLLKDFAPLRISLRSPSLDEKYWLLTTYSDVEPGVVYLYNWETNELQLQYHVRPEIPREALSTMEPISYPSSDGLEIPAYLTLPKGYGRKNLPLLVMPHGGPWVRDFWGYNTYAQFFANRGYAVLQPNFRISTGYGKKFLNAGNGQWGDLMQDDLTWGVNYLIEKGIADKNKVGIFGGSYGGYATLAGLAFTPDVYACGISFVGPSSLITLLESIPPYWEAGRKMFHVRMGDPTTEEGKKQLIRQSPLFSAEKIKSPLMVVQGENDPRVKKQESDQIVLALYERGFPVVYLNADDEGHGFARPINSMAFIAAMEEFLSHYLKGRYQQDMPAHIAKRLKEITVAVEEMNNDKV